MYRLFRLYLRTRDSRPVRAFPASRLVYSCDELFHLTHICCRLETSDNISLSVNNKFREVPFNVRIVLEIRIDLLKKRVHSGAGCLRLDPFRIFFKSLE